MTNGGFNTFMLFPVLLIIGILVVGAVIAYLNSKALQKAWAELAERAGLAFEPGQFIFAPPRVLGVYRGHQMVLDTFTRQHGKSSTTYTRIVASLNGQPNLQLALYQEGVFSKIGKVVGMQDIQVGDDELDRRFIIKGQPESVITSIFTDINVRDKLLQAHSLNIESQGSVLRFQKTGTERDVEYLLSLLDLMSELAHAIERATGTAPAHDLPFEHAW